jgi:hypothetical protein
MGPPHGTPLPNRVTTGQGGSFIRSIILTGLQSKKYHY